MPTSKSEGSCSNGVMGEVTTGRTREGETERRESINVSLERKENVRPDGALLIEGERRGTQSNKTAGVGMRARQAGMKRG